MIRPRRRNRGCYLHRKKPVELLEILRNRIFGYVWIAWLMLTFLTNTRVRRFKAENLSRGAIIIVILGTDVLVIVCGNPSFVLAAAWTDRDAPHGSTGSPIPLAVSAEVTWLANVVVVVVTELGVRAVASWTWKNLVWFLQVISCFLFRCSCCCCDLAVLRCFFWLLGEIRWSLKTCTGLFNVVSSRLIVRLRILKDLD